MNADDQPEHPNPMPSEPMQPPPSFGAPEASHEHKLDTMIVSEHKPPFLKRRSTLLILLLLILFIAAGWYAFMKMNKHSNSTQSANNTKPSSSLATNTQASSSASTAQTTSGLTFDPNKNYGNKYSNGLLPVGDNKYVTDAAKKGFVYACSQYAQNLKTDPGGADTRGPWFVNNNTQYDINKKAHVAGSVHWTSSISNTVSGNTRTIVSNDLPTHPTGVFPVASSDPAYLYDRNPNSIKSQSLTYTLAADPTYGAPSCMGGQSGTMLTGVAIFSGFDAGGRDAGAWELQDSCSGHPEKTGEYHYHTLSSCITDTSVSTVVGFALDGFPITGPKVGNNNFLTTDDLDECHGITSTITLDGKQKTTYHYVMTQDFPYSVSCFRAKAINPPGLPAGGSNQAPPKQ